MANEKDRDRRGDRPRPQNRRAWLGTVAGVGAGAWIALGRQGEVLARARAFAFADDGDKAKAPDWGDEEIRRRRAEAIARGVAFLRARQEPNGGWSTDRSAGVTALAASALARSGRVAPADPVLSRAMAYLETKAGPNGGYEEDGQANYVTAIVLATLKDLNAEGRNDPVIRRGQEFLKNLQWQENKGKTPDSDYYGGAGYRGDGSRPDLSNTAFMIEALRETGLPPDDPNLRKALLFVSRCQNLESEFNDQPWAGKVNDGGFIYSAANGGESKAGEVPGVEGGLRSYAAMTYAGFKSMIYAGLTPDDPRVKAATDYMRRNYRLDENPGMGQVGLYYYYHTFAKAMSLAGWDRFRDAAGVEHDWRADLVDAVASRQNPDGSWVNPADRFMEGDPNLVTAYALLALSHVR